MNIFRERSLKPLLLMVSIFDEVSFGNKLSVSEPGENAMSGGPRVVPEEELEISEGCYHSSNVLTAK